MNHGECEYARGEVHNNPVAPFNARLERAKFRVFHSLSQKHKQCYFDEVEVRWNQRAPVDPVTKKSRKKTDMTSLPVIDKIANLLRAAFNVEIGWTPCGSIRAMA